MFRLFARNPAATALCAALAAYAASLVVLARVPGATLGEPLFLLGVLGIGFPLLARLLTRRPRSVHAPLAPPRRRIGAMLVYLVAFSIAVLGWGFSAIDAQWPDGPQQAIARLIVKLTTMAALPALLFLQDNRQRPRFGTPRLLVVLSVMAVAFVAFQAVFGRGLKTLAALSPSTDTLLWAVPACLFWQIVETGLCEELLFRRVLQQRLADAGGSMFAAILWASLLFGLAHAPGLYLRGASVLEGVAQPTLSWAVAYSIAIVAPTGLVFGTLWARTRSLWLVVALHGIVDLIPQLSPFIQSWR